jgi:hypothetical protein
MRLGADKAPILMVVAPSSPCGTAWINSRRSSIDGGSIVRARRQLENRNSNELTDDLGINSDNLPANSGLKYQPAVIVLHHL